MNDKELLDVLNETCISRYMKTNLELNVERVKEYIELISYRETSNLGLSLLKKQFSLISEIRDTGNNMVIYYPEWAVKSQTFKNRRSIVSLKKMINSLTICTDVLQVMSGTKFYIIIFVKD